jgi:hypothetical protein
MKYVITKEYTIQFDTSGGSTMFGRLIRLIAFPFKYVLFGKASI